MGHSMHPRSAPGLAYRPEVDGLRAIAVLAVMLFHARVPQLPGGYLGVDFFFVISGDSDSGLGQRRALIGAVLSAASVPHPARAVADLRADHPVCLCAAAARRAGELRPVAGGQRAAGEQSAALPDRRVLGPCRRIQANDAHLVAGGGGAILSAGCADYPVAVAVRRAKVTDERVGDDCGGQPGRGGVAGGQ